MQEHYQPMSSDDHLTDAQITSAIHYLDPDASGKRTEHNAGELLWPFLIVLVGTLVYIWLYLRTA
jgi:hypothetical protein